MRDALKDMFTDNRFQRIGRNRYWAEVDGRKIGVVLATKNARYDDHALNKADLDRVLAAKREGRLDDAFVVAAKTNGSGIPIFSDQIDAETLASKLAGELPMVGRFGEFFVIPAGLGFPARASEHEPF